MFIVTIDNKISITDIIKTNKVCYCVVKWEKFKNKSGVTQCYKCQSFGHIANNCYRDPYCVKCAGNHLTNSCDKNVTETPLCINCKEQHPANFRGCPVYERQLKLKRNYPVVQNSKDKYITNKFAGLNKDQYPALNKNDNNDIPQNTPTWPRTSNNENLNNTTTSDTDILTIIKSLLNSFNLSKLLSIIKPTLIKLYNAKDSISKVSVLLEALMEIIC